MSLERTGQNEHEKQIGAVALVGAGCEAGLITVRGLSLLQRADVVIYDDLLDETLLSEAPPQCEKIYVGKRRGKHAYSQNEIEKIMARYASEGKFVVRLKGGDSFVFGRGGEECLALKNANIPFEVVPGVSSAIAVPEHAGIPVTMRGIAQSFTVVTGTSGAARGDAAGTMGAMQRNVADNASETVRAMPDSASGATQNEPTERVICEAPISAETPVDYETLSKTGGTLVFLMGLSHIEEITKRLQAGGKDKNIPAAVISNGFRPNEKRINGTLETIAKCAKEEGAETPAVLVIGETAGLDLRCQIADCDDGYGEKPASTDLRVPAIKRPHILVTGTHRFVEKAVRRINETLGGRGVRTTPCPCLTVEPIENAARNMFLRLSSYDWLVFTSMNGVEVFFSEFFGRNRKTEDGDCGGMDIRLLGDTNFACIGNGTADALYRYGIVADLVPSVHTSEMLGETLVAELTGDGVNKSAGRSATTQCGTPNPRVLLLRAENASPHLPEILSQAGISYTDIPIYQTKAIRYDRRSGQAEEHETQETALSPDMIVFASAACVRAFYEQKNAGAEMNTDTRLVCIGTHTADAAKKLYRDNGCEILTADEATVDGIIDKIAALIKEPV